MSSITASGGCAATRLSSSALVVAWPVISMPPLVEDRWMDPGGDHPQFAQCVPEPVAGAGEQAEAGCRLAVRSRHQLASGLLDQDRRGQQVVLGTVVQIPLDAPALGVEGVHQ